VALIRQHSNFNRNGQRKNWLYLIRKPAKMLPYFSLKRGQFNDVAHLFPRCSCPFSIIFPSIFVAALKPTANQIRRYADRIKNKYMDKDKIYKDF
jgi:hypothetical protein